MISHSALNLTVIDDKGRAIFSMSPTEKIQRKEKNVHILI